MKKVGIIRCQETEDVCQGRTDMRIAREGKMVFEATGPVQIVGFVSCGGCPGKRAITRAETMVERAGAEIIVIASCISKGNPFGFPCPHFADILAALKRRLGEKVEIFEWSH